MDQREHISGWTPLHAAAYAARSKVLPILANHGADVESRDHAGKPRCAVPACQHETNATEAEPCRLTELESGGYPGATPMILACRSGSVSAVRTLHQLNASLWATQPGNKRPHRRTVTIETPHQPCRHCTAPFIENMQFLAESPRAPVMRR